MLRIASKQTIHTQCNTAGNEEMKDIVCEINVALNIWRTYCVILHINETLDLNIGLYIWI